MVAGSHQLDWWVTVKKITLSFLVPHGAGGNHDRISLQRQRGDAGGCAGKLAKERDKNSFACLRVEVGQDAERAAFAQDAQRLSGSALFIYGTISKPSSADTRVQTNQNYATPKRQGALSEKSLRAYFSPPPASGPDPPRHTQ